MDAPIHHMTLRKAERLYIKENFPLDEVATQCSLEPMQLSPYLDAWEAERQTLKAAETLFVRHGMAVEDIAKALPITEKELATLLDEFEAKRQAYLAPLPSSQVRLQRMIDAEVLKYSRRMKPLPGVKDLAALAQQLKSLLTVLDQIEGFIYLFNASFLPSVNLSDEERALVDRLMQEFRGFIKLQMLSGNR